MKFNKKKLSKFSAIILSLIIVFETFLFSIANAGSVSVVNWSALISMLISNFSHPIITTFENKIKEYINFLERLGKLPGVLQNITDLSNDFSNQFSNQYHAIMQRMGDVTTSDDWIALVKNGDDILLKPFSFSSDESKLIENYGKYAGYIKGDTKVLYESMNTLTENEVDELTRAHFLVRIKELDAAKATLAQSTINNGATLLALKKMAENIEKAYGKLGTTMQGNNYHKEQAVKDLLKVQMINTQLINEIIRKMLNERMMNVAIMNKAYTDQRNKILKDMEPYFIEASIKK